MECAEAQKNTNKVTIHLVRHGYAEHNQGRNIYGTRAYFSNKYRFSQLVDRGREQARLLRAQIDRSQIVVDRIYTSPLDRALQTTSIIFPTESDYDRTQIHVTDNLRELNYAHPCNERKVVNVLRLSYPEFNYSLMQSNDDRLFVDGDTYSRFLSMMQELTEFVNSWYENDNHDRAPSIVLVSHESFLLEFAQNHLRINLSSIDNCEMITLDIEL
jgi:broad specificity phosphatase PhoE